MQRASWHRRTALLNFIFGPDANKVGAGGFKKRVEGGEKERWRDEGMETSRKHFSLFSAQQRGLRLGLVGKASQQRPKVLF